MQAHIVDLGTRKLQIYLPLSRTKMLAKAQKSDDDDLPYWAFFWPSAVGLAMLLASEPLLAGRSIIELGAGSAVAGLAAASAGGKVLLTDYLQEAIDLCAYNAAKNNLRVDVMRADWKNTAIWPHGTDVIIASEVHSH